MQSGHDDHIQTAIITDAAGKALDAVCRKDLGSTTGTRRAQYQRASGMVAQILLDARADRIC